MVRTNRALNNSTKPKFKLWILFLRRRRSLDACPAARRRRARSRDRTVEIHVHVFIVDLHVDELLLVKHKGNIVYTCIYIVMHYFIRIYKCFIFHSIISCSLANVYCKC